MKAGEANKHQLLAILRSLFGDVEVEHRFHPTRRWRFDYAVPSHMLAVEYQGHSGFVGGKVSGHSSIKGLTNDCEKFNQATLLGWRVLSFTALHFRADGRAKHKLSTPLETLERAANTPIRKMNVYCRELEEHFREIGRLVTGCEPCVIPAAARDAICNICEKALGETGVRAFWPEKANAGDQVPR